ncbi:hypothetical protein TNCV_3463861 [Trichonephila clavipes]|nr:hypothetical protein TNCV_3463861 [Trichonephila clavipes]
MVQRILIEGLHMRRVFAKKFSRLLKEDEKICSENTKKKSARRNDSSCRDIQCEVSGVPFGSTHLQVQSAKLPAISPIVHVRGCLNLFKSWLSRDWLVRLTEEDSRGGSELANDAKMVAKLAANLVAKNDANLALPPRFRQVLIESPL